MCSTCIPAVFADGSSSSPPRPSRSATSRSRFLASAPTSRGYPGTRPSGGRWAIVAMTIAIILYDQLLFRPMVAWADKFRFEQTASQMVPKSAVLDLFRRSRLLKRLGEPIGTGLQRAARARIALPRRLSSGKRQAAAADRRCRLVRRSPRRPRICSMGARPICLIRALVG